MYCSDFVYVVVFARLPMHSFGRARGGGRQAAREDARAPLGRRRHHHRGRDARVRLQRAHYRLQRAGAARRLPPPPLSSIPAHARSHTCTGSLQPLQLYEPSPTFKGRAQCRM
eukprot:6178014-Pleurochrysis_carterae.AAC.3